MRPDRPTDPKRPFLIIASEKRPISERKREADTARAQQAAVGAKIVATSRREPKRYEQTQPSFQNFVISRGCGHPNAFEAA